MIVVFHGISGDGRGVIHVLVWAHRNSWPTRRVLILIVLYTICYSAAKGLVLRATRSELTTRSKSHFYSRLYHLSYVEVGNCEDGWVDVQIAQLQQ